MRLAYLNLSVVRIALAGVVSTLALNTTPALAASDNFYRSQFDGGETATKTFVPFGLAVNSSGDVYVVSDEEPGAVDEFNASGTGAPLAEFDSSMTAVKSFTSVAAAVDAGGDLYVADLEHGVVDEFNATGTAVLREINGSKTAGASFQPIGVAIDGNGDLLVADLEHGVVDEFNSTGTEVLGEINGGETVAKSFLPFSVAVSPDGDVYVASGEEEHTVVDEFEPTGATHQYKLIHEIKGSETPQGSFFPYKVAVAANGEVYVVDDENHLVDRFSSSGGYLSQFDGHATPQGAFEPFGLAVGLGGEVYVGDGGHGFVDIFGPPEEVAAESQWVTEVATQVTTTRAKLNGVVNPEGGAVTACEFEYGTSASYGESVACEQASTQIGEGADPVAVSAEITGLEPATKYYYRVVGTGVKGAGNGGGETFTTRVRPPIVKIAPVDGVNGHCATFNGEVDPEGSATTYQFEDSIDGMTWVALGQRGAGEGTGEVTVSQVACALAGSSTYHVRLTAENSGGSVTSTEESFGTPISAPQISGVGATVLGGSEATLYATIHPEKQATTYRFEYGTTSRYDVTVPAGEGNAGAAPIQVSQMITGLTQRTTYHFRVVAINATGTTDVTDHTLTTSQVAPEGELAPGTCVNEVLREQGAVDPRTDTPYAMQLPDCRAYEQVTPPFKSFNNITTKPQNLATASTAAISTDGAPVLEDSVPLLGGGGAGADGQLAGTFYALERGASGWSATSLTLAASVFPTSHEELASKADAAEGLWAAATPGQSIYAENLYRRDGDGTFLDIGPIAPPSATAGPAHGPDKNTEGLVGQAKLVGASTDLSDVLFQLSSPQLEVQESESVFWPGDGTTFGQRPSLYEYVGTGHTGEGSDVPAFVGVDNAGAQISQCGTGLGADVRHEGTVVPNGVSAAGSTVFFNAQAGGCAAGASGPMADQVYARIGIPGDVQTTVNVAGTSGCATSTSCNVTSPVTYQGASSDGSKVFFTAAQAGLASGDGDATDALYECELPGDGGGTLEPSGTVNACPNLKAISRAGANSGANVQSVMAVSEEGSRVYFTATGVLTSEPDRSLPLAHEVAEEGKDNLYVWEARSANGEPEGHISFIATLPSANPNEAQATPDGGYLVFTTTADLTSDDTSTAAQAFRYDAQTAELVRISVGHDGFNQDGNTTTDQATLASTSQERRTISENGAYVVFQSNDALTPQVRGGVQNVYEWHDGNVYLISDGTDSQGEAGLIGMDASGENIFFVTADQLVGQDEDEDADVYDARIDGGFPAQTPEASCNGEECQGPITSPFAPLTPGSTAPPTIGNLAPGSTTFPIHEEPKPKLLTRKQRLARALKQCRKDRNRRIGRACEVRARKKYGVKAAKRRRNK